MRKFAFVLEQTLGHVSHTRNIERALASAADVEATVIRLNFPPPVRAGGVPLLQNWSLRASWAARRALLTRLHQDRLDGVFIHTQVASLLSSSIMRSIPTVISMDATPLNIDLLADAYRHQHGSRPVELVKKLINIRALGAARALVCWSEWTADSLRRDYGVEPTKISVIHPGVDVDLFRPRRPETQNDRPRLLFVGADFVRKGGLQLLEALHGLDGQVDLDIVSPNAPSIDSDRVRVHRTLIPQSPQLVELYRRADIFVLPTLGDAFGQVVAEALACGLPVVSTDVGGIPEMVESGVNGFLVPPGDAVQLAQALRRLVDDPRRRVRMGQASLARARLSHDAMRNNRRILDLMGSLATVRQAVPA